MKPRKLNYDLVKENLEWRHKNNCLLNEITWLTVAEHTLEFYMNEPKALRQVEQVLNLALTITNTEFVPDLDPNNLQQQQIRCYVLCEGGFLGSFAARQPADFYIDDRTSFTKKEKTIIYQQVEILKTLAVAQNLNPHMLPECPNFHACGIF